MDDIEYVVLSDISEVNPPTDLRGLDGNTTVSFIPMADVSESGEWINQQARLLKDVRNGYTCFQEDDILFAKITPCMENGKGAHAAKLLNRIGFGTTEFHILRAKPRVHSRFIYHWIMNEELRRKAEARMTGSAGQRRVPASFFWEFKLPFFPLPEQRRIAEILDTIDEAIQKTEALISKLKAMKQGLLHDLLTRGLDKNGKLRDPKAHPKQFKNSPLWRMPIEWQVGSINNLAINCDGRRIPLKQADRDKRHGIYPYYGASGIIDWIDDYLFDGDYVLLGEDGENVVSRELPLAFRASGKFWVNNHAHVFEPRPGVDIRYLTELLEYTNYNKIFLGSAQPKLTQEGLKRLLFQIPMPSEQAMIGDRLETHDTRIRTEEQYRDKLKLQKNGLMHDLLIGKVRVQI